MLKMKTQMQTAQTWFKTLPLFLCLLVFGASTANAQHHADGSAWIDRDASEATQVHMMGDPLSFVEFPEQCFGGMMAPDSLLCELEILPENQWPEQCPIAIECVVTDPDGQHMLDGTGMHGNMMRKETSITIHYDPDQVEGMGIDTENLCLGQWNGSGYEARPGAIHNSSAATFVFSTVDPGGSYAVIPRATVPASAFSWSKLKARHAD
jgi:hypothetical protein